MLLSQPMHRTLDPGSDLAPIPGSQTTPACARSRRRRGWWRGVAIGWAAGWLAGGQVAAEDAWANRFATPPADARIVKIIHGWPDSAEAQDALIAQLQTQGFGGVVCNVAFQDYLESEAHWQAFVRAVNAAKAAGLALWLYDERGYPSGNAGGLVLRDRPEWEARGLLVASREAEAGPVRLELPPGRVVLAGAFPCDNGQPDVRRGQDLTAQVREGRLDWQVPAGRWQVVGFTESRLYEGTHADGNLWQKMPYVNLLEREPTRRFLEVTHDRYARHLGDDLGRYFVSTFTDEPSLMSCFLRPMPYRPLPWSPGLPDEFRRRRGYGLGPEALVSLAVDTGAEAARYRHDYWLTVAELVSEHFFGQIQERCRALGVPSGGHLLAEEGLVTHVPLYGDFLRCARRLDVPSLDCLTSQPGEVPWWVARLLASAAELEGRSLVMCETSDHAQVWRAPGDRRPVRRVTEAEIRGTVNRLMVCGVNAITSYFSFGGLDDAALRRLNAWVGRCGAALTGGQATAEIAVVTPVESVWTRFTPSRHWTQEAVAAAPLEHLWRAAAEALFQARRDFTLVDSRSVVEARVEDGELVHGALRWRVVVLPGVDTLPLAAWENLERFVRRGGVVVGLTHRPVNSEREFPSAQVERIGQRLFGPASAEPKVETPGGGGAGIFLPAGAEGLLGLVLEGLLEPELKVDDRRAPLRVTRRRHGDQDVYLAINDSARPWAGTVGYPAGAGERWDPASGERVESLGGGARALVLEPYGAAVLRFPARSRPPRGALVAGALPNLVRRSVPEVEPVVVGGEFVRGEPVRRVEGAGAASPAWEVRATLTRGQVDTFQFAQFHFEPPLDLRGAEGIEIESWVPGDQRTPNRLLVILREVGGGDFLAETGRSLAGPVHARSFVPLSRLQLAGWSKDGDGELDAGRVDEIRIGWGGYLGAEGERVQFRVALPGVLSSDARFEAEAHGRLPQRTSDVKEAQASGQ